MADVKAEPPGGGRQDHSAMRTASMLPVEGPASTDTLAANGGLDVPGREPASSVARARELETISPAPEPIPGAYEPDTATHREPGAIGGRFNGADAPPGADDDELVKEEARRIGGNVGPRRSRRF